MSMNSRLFERACAINHRLRERYATHRANLVGSRCRVPRTDAELDERPGLEQLERRVLLANVSPVLGNLIAAPNLVVQGQTLTLTANQVRDPDGTVAAVEFFHDSN